MNRFWNLFRLFIVIASLRLCTSDRRTECSAYEPGGDFDHFTLVLQWVPSYCSTWIKCTAPFARFTIHGLWPDFYDSHGSFPVCTGSAPSFDVKEVESIRSEMEYKWPSVNPRRSNHWFWSHEYESHGTVAQSNPATRGIFKYFKVTLQLYDSVQPQEWLSSRGINPSNSTAYPQEEFLSAIETPFGSVIKMRCYYTSSSEAYVVELMFCFDKNLQRMDCSNSDRLRNCRPHILYPTT